MFPFSHHRRRLLALFAVTALVVRATPAAAEDSPAEKLFREGRALMLGDRFDEACPLLAKSQELEPHVGTLLNLAACHERQGKVGSAWVEYQKALTAARAEGQAERVRLAEERIAVLDPRVPWLRTTAAESATITLDGAVLVTPTLGQELPVDPGPHVVRGEKPGAVPFDERVELREGEHRTVTVRFVQAEAPGAALPETLVVEPKSPPVRQKSRWILEPGIFVGYLLGNVKSVARPRPLYPSAVTLTDQDSHQTTCAAFDCELGDIKEGDGFTGGINVFAGYAPTDTIDIGGRFIAGPEVGVAGASVVAIGPSIAVHATDALTIGAWALLGNATLKGHAPVAYTGTYKASESFVAGEGSLEGGPGIGLELSVRLFELGRGAVVANTTPFMIAGSGTAFCVPVGLAYRFQ